MASIAIPDGLNLAFDLVMLVALAGLWIMWWKTSRKQRAIEGLLAEAAREIDRASISLNEAMLHIARIKREEVAAAETKPAARRTPEPTEPEPEPASSASGAAPARPKPETSQNSQVTQLLRMHREGQSEEAIATALSLPTAQVRLLLKLHGATRK